MSNLRHWNTSLPEKLRALPPSFWMDGPPPQFLVVIVGEIEASCPFIDSHTSGAILQPDQK